MEALAFSSVAGSCVGFFAGGFLGAQVGVDVIKNSPKPTLFRGTMACISGGIAGAAVGTVAGIIWPLTVAVLYTSDQLKDSNTPKPNSEALKPRS